MSVENLKSANITNLDASPVIANTAGEGAPAFLYTNFDFVTVSAAASLTSTYRIVRVPSTAKIKTLTIESEAMVAGAFDISVYYSDSTSDGTQVPNQGLVVPSTGSQFFANSFNCASAVAPTNIINNAGNNPMSNRNKPLWSALGLTSDPGGSFDIVAVVDTTAVTTGAARLGLRVDFTG